MSIANPKTPEEWGQYISTLRGHSLWSKALAANSMQFVTRLVDDEEYTAAEVTGIMRRFAKRFADLGEQPPLDGYYDLVGMMREPETQAIKLPENVEYDPEPDEVEKALNETDLQSDWAG